MADHPLRPATRRRLGGPLPHQLADGTRAPLRAGACYAVAPFPPRTRAQGAYPVLATLSSGYPRPQGRLPTRYSPVCRCTREAEAPLSPSTCMC